MGRNLNDALKYVQRLCEEGNIFSPSYVYCLVDSKGVGTVRSIVPVPNPDWEGGRGGGRGPCVGLSSSREGFQFMFRLNGPPENFWVLRLGTGVPDLLFQTPPRTPRRKTSEGALRV